MPQFDHAAINFFYHVSTNFSTEETNFDHAGVWLCRDQFFDSRDYFYDYVATIFLSPLLIFEFIAIFVSTIATNFSTTATRFLNMLRLIFVF